MMGVSVSYHTLFQSPYRISDVNGEDLYYRYDYGCGDGDVRVETNEYLPSNVTCMVCFLVEMKDENCWDPCSLLHALSWLSFSCCVNSYCGEAHGWSMYTHFVMNSKSIFNVSISTHFPSSPTSFHTTSAISVTPATTSLPIVYHPSPHPLPQIFLCVHDRCHWHISMSHNPSSPLSSFLSRTLHVFIISWYVYVHTLHIYISYDSYHWCTCHLTCTYYISYQHVVVLN